MSRLTTTAPVTLTAPEDLTIRRAYSDDRSALARLAALDSARPFAGPALLVEQDGELRAALDLERGAVIADPFHPTAHLVALPRLHAAPPAAVREGRTARLARRARRVLPLAGRRAARPLRARHAR